MHVSSRNQQYPSLSSVIIFLPNLLEGTHGLEKQTRCTRSSTSQRGTLPTEATWSNHCQEASDYQPEAFTSSTRAADCQHFGGFLYLACSHEGFRVLHIQSVPPVSQTLFPPALARRESRPIPVKHSSSVPSCTRHESRSWSDPYQANLLAAIPQLCRWYKVSRTAIGSFVSVVTRKLHQHS